MENSELLLTESIHKTEMQRRQEPTAPKFQHQVVDAGTAVSGTARGGEGQALPVPAVEKFPPAAF